MEIVLEAIVTVLGIVIYGMPEAPRHPVFRNSVRLCAFGGAAILLAAILGLFDGQTISRLVIVVWVVSGLVVLVAEYDLGDRRIAIASWAVVATLVGAGLAVTLGQKLISG